MMKAAGTSETLLNVCQTAQRYSSEDGCLHVDGFVLSEKQKFTN
jgi:hypothetical protein